MPPASNKISLNVPLDLFNNISACPHSPRARHAQAALYAVSNASRSSRVGFFFETLSACVRCQTSCASVADWLMRRSLISGSVVLEDLSSEA